MFKDSVCYQEEVRDPNRIPEVLNRCIEKAIRGSAPAQMNIPRDMWTKVIEVELPAGVELERSSGGAQSVTAAAELLSKAKFPVILNGAFGISMNELTACGRGEWPAVTMVVFRNFQWGAEKRNTTLWYADNFVGTELNKGVEYAKVAEACGLKGVKVETEAELESALTAAVEGQMQRKETTLIEVILNQELGEPFRRDAMTAPVKVAGVSKADMRA